jgi:Flp pilus assembly protein TadG
MASFLSRLAVSKGGASALEFAILLPVFVMLLFGTVQLGVLFYYAGTVQHALEETAREVMVVQDMTPAQVESAIRNRLEDLTTVDVVVTYDVDSVGDASVAHVNAAFTLDIIIPFVPSFSVPMDAHTSIPVIP